MHEATFHIALGALPRLLAVDGDVGSILGFSSEDFLSGQVHLQEMFHPDDQDLALQLFSSDGEAMGASVRCRVRGADGQIRCVKGEYTKTPKPLEGVAVLDLRLSDVREIEEPGDQFLVDSYKSLLRQTSDYIYLKNRNHVLLAASQSVAELTDKTDDVAELSGKTDYDLHPEQEADHYYRLEKQLFEAGSCVHEIHDVVASDGRKRWIDNRKYPVIGPTGEIVGLLGVAPDITPYLEATQKLRESEESLREAQKIGGLGSFVLDLRTKEWKASEELELLLGIGPGHARGIESLWSLIHPGDRAAIEECLHAYLAGRCTEFDCEYRVIRQSDGTARWVRIKGTPEVQKDGESVALHGTVQDITERKEALTALQESKELLQLFIKHSPVALAMLDREMRYLAVSERWLQIHELHGIELIHRSHYEIFPSLPEEWKCLHRHALEGEVAPADECCFTRRDGSPQWLRREVRPWYTADGTIGGIILFAEDVTEARRAQSALCENKELLELFIKHAPVALAMFDREMRYLAASQRWLKDFSLNEAEIIGHCHYNVLANIPEHWKEAHRRGLAGEKINVEEDRYERADGTVYWSRWEMVPWRTANGSVGGIVIFAEDITKQKETEERLSLAASVFTHAREGILITDGEGTILDVNETFSRITGYPREEALGRNPRILKSGLQSAEFYRTMWRALREEGQWSGEIWNRTKGGKVYPAMLTISAVRGEQGQVVRYVALFADISELKEKQRQLEKIAHYDVLTGLPNRVLLADRLRQAMAQARRRKRSLAVAYIDLDGFKAINDTHGHVVGDHVLTALASRMKFTLREGDTLARLGGDEFVVLLLDLSGDEDGFPVLKRLLESLARPIRVGSHSLTVSASIGVVYYPEVEEVDADQLLRQADQAMYQAKLAGKNRYHVFSPLQDFSVRSRYESLERVREALAKCQLVLFYQPKVNMRTGSVIGVEALLRLQHPERGLLSPAMFMPATENHPLSIEIGEWGIENALAQMELWTAYGLSLPVSVNISGFHLQRSDFADRLRTLLDAHPLVEPSRLELEVLESSALLDVVQASRALEACQRMGVSLALDDFGTGYSSLTYLKQLPTHTLKIDRTFVSGMLENCEDLSIVEGVLSLAKAFRRQVIAEGVESVEHGVMLLKLGCELAQGYGISPPMPASEFPAWMASWHPDPRWAHVRPVHDGNRSLMHARVEHLELLTGVEAFLDGKRHVSPAADLRNCRLSEWLSSKAQSGYGALPAFRTVRGLHQRFHVVLQELLDRCGRGNKSEGVAQVKELHELYGEMVKQIEILGARPAGRVRTTSRKKPMQEGMETTPAKEGTKAHRRRPMKELNANDLVVTQPQDSTQRE